MFFSCLDLCREVFWLICYFFYSFQDGSATGRHNESCSSHTLAAFDSMRMTNMLLTRGCLTSKTSDTSVRALEPLLHFFDADTYKAEQNNGPCTKLKTLTKEATRASAVQNHIRIAYCQRKRRRTSESCGEVAPCARERQCGPLACAWWRQRGPWQEDVRLP